MYELRESATSAPAGCPDIPVAGAICDKGADLAQEGIGPVPGLQDLENGANAAQSAVAFGSDPIGYLAEKARSGAESLANDLLPALTHAMEPNLSADWFISTYRVTFALAIMIWVLQLVWTFVAYARKRLGPQEVVDAVVERSPIFLIGCVFGPPLGAFMVKVLGALTDDIVKFALGQSSDSISEGLSKQLESGDVDRIAGGALVALIVYVVMILGLLFCLLTLIVMLVTLYLSGVVFPLGWQWITNPRQSDRAMRIVRVWAGVLLAQPLMFLMLGVSLAMSTGTALEGQLPGNSDHAPEGLRLLIGLLVTCVALWMTAFTPTMLAKFAPILPTDGGNNGVGRDAMPSPGKQGSPIGAGRGGLAEASQQNRVGGSDASADGGGGGSDLTKALTDDGSGDSSPGTAEMSEGIEAGAVEGAETAGVEGAETGPADVAIAGAGALAGGTKAAVEDAPQTAGAEIDKDVAAGESDSGSGSSTADAGGGTGGGSDVDVNSDTSGVAGSGEGGGVDVTPQASDSTESPTPPQPPSGPQGSGNGGSGWTSLVEQAGSMAADNMDHQHPSQTDRRRDDRGQR